MLDALNNSPQCSADPACSAGRFHLEQLVQARNNGTLDAAQKAAAQNVQATVQRLSALLATAGGSLRAAGINSPTGAPQRIDQLQQGADALADGSQRLSEGVRVLVDQTKKMGGGMNQASDLLLSMKRDASQPSMGGMYIPPKVLTSDDFNNAAKMFISPNGHSVRFFVETKFDPFSTAAMDQVASILDTARGAQPNTALSDASISVIGSTAMYSALRSYYNDDFRLVVIMTLLVVFLILEVGELSVWRPIQCDLTGIVSQWIAQEEIFGPVTDILMWDDEDDMIAQVNDSIYGLAGGLWTRDLSRAHRFSRAMQTGTVWVNRNYNFQPGQGVGGYKQSGFGREGTLDTLNHYTVTKNVVINLDEHARNTPAV
jgi:X-X-X-Leu-X-X-Gly heptad repeat protein